MKKLFFGGLFVLPFCCAGQAIVTDTDTGITYSTELISRNGALGFYISDSRVIDSDDSNEIGGKLYTGPAERTVFATNGEATVVKTCLNTSMWPCMFVRKDR